MPVCGIAVGEDRSATTEQTILAATNRYETHFDQSANKQAEPLPCKRWRRKEIKIIEPDARAQIA